ncbi:MAG: hypothetical protein JSR82_08765 [Verrucomicrobia bacterium]|nr:hypothetical protein [Verrucomicrobiota bacterium]
MKLLPYATALVFASGLWGQQLGQSSDSFLLPSPETVFDALAKVPNVDFTKLAASTTGGADPAKLKTASDAVKAFVLGARVADAYVAVQARDLEAYQRATAAIEATAFDFTQDQSFRRKLSTANKMAKDERWLDLKTVLETFRGDVVRELQLHRSQDMVTLATFGGWLRGLQLATLTLAQTYDADSTRLLRQPALVSHLRRKMNALGPDSKAESFVEKITERMPQIVQIVDAAGGAAITQADIKKLNALASELMNVP